MNVNINCIVKRICKFEKLSNTILLFYYITTILTRVIVEKQIIWYIYLYTQTHLLTNFIDSISVSINNYCEIISEINLYIPL